MRNRIVSRRWKIQLAAITICCAPALSQAFTLTAGSVKFARLDTPFLTSEPAQATGSAIPLSGFIPQVVYGLTNEQSSAYDFNYYSVASSSPGGSGLPVGQSPYYGVATFDTGSSFNMIGATDINSFNLAGAGLTGPDTIQIIGASGTESADVTEPLGVYVTGFGGAASNGAAVSVNNRSSMQGQWNTSILTADPSSQLPSLIGIPMAAQYQTVITNSRSKELTVAGQTYVSPEVDLQALDTPLPSNYVRLSLDVQSPQGTVQTPYYFPDTTTLTDPEIPTTWGSFLANVNLTGAGGSASNQPFLLDTGSQVTVLSEDTAAALGFYSAGPNPSTPDFYVEIAGVGGTTEVPGFYVPTLSVMTNGGPITWNNVPAIVLDLTDPRDDIGYIPGVLGMNLFTDRDLIINGGITDPSIGISPKLSPQWCVDANGNWGDGVSNGYAFNWIDGAPDDVDAPANFLGAISQPRTVTVDANYTVGSITFDNSNRYTIAGPGTLTLQTSAGPASIHVISGSHTIAAPLALANDTIVTVDSAGSILTISGGVQASSATLTKSGAGTMGIGGGSTFGGLAVQQGKLVFLPGAPGPIRTASLTVAAGATLDLTNNSMIVDYTSSSPVAAVTQLLKNGYDNGHWDLAGIVSSSAATNGATAIGLADNAQMGLLNFRGQSISLNDVLISYTWYGDANLDGKVDSADLAMFAPIGSAAGWTTGDFNYDGVINSDDYALFMLGYSAQTGAFPASVPEPAALCAIFLLLPLRRRNLIRQ